MRYLKTQKGALLIAAIILIVLMGFLGVIVASLVSTQSVTSVNEMQSAQAFFVAGGGMERALYAFSTGTACGSLTFTQNIGVGQFQTTGTVYPLGPTSTLSSGIGAADLVVPVSSIANYASHGRITVDSEAIDYAGTSSVPANCAPYGAPCVTLARRGAAGTTPAAHLSGAAVLQNECLIRSTGTVAGPAGAAIRVAERAAIAGVAGIAVDAASSTSGNNTVSLTWSHTVSGTNRVLVVGVAIRNNGTPSETVTNVTYAGTPLNFVGAQNNGTSVRVEIWQLPAPATGTSNVVVTLTASAFVAAGAVSLMGVDQTNPIDAGPVFNTATSNAPLIPSITMVTNNAWVIDALAYRLNPTATASGGQALRWNTTTGGGPNNGIGGAGSTKGPITPAGSTTMGWLLSSVQDWAMGAVAVRPSGGALSIVDWLEINQ